MILLDLQPGDEVILPSYTFVSTANAVVRAGGVPIFCDIRRDTLNLDEAILEELITSKTKAIVPVHYAGVACEMDEIMKVAQLRRLSVVEDAAQGVNAFYKGKALGSIGDMGAYSFHETKNYNCGEGGALCINDRKYIDRAEILRDKGTNRRQFMTGEVDKYTWVDIGSSYVPSEILAAFLLAQLENLDVISKKRESIYSKYDRDLAELADLERLVLPHIPGHCKSNYHMYYVLLRDRETRDSLMEFLQSKEIYSVFHYVPLHSSPIGQKFHSSNRVLQNTDELSDRLLRLPFYYELTDTEQERVSTSIYDFFT